MNISGYSWQTTYRKSHFNVIFFVIKGMAVVDKPQKNKKFELAWYGNIGARAGFCIEFQMLTFAV